MILNGEFYLNKSSGYDEALKKCIRDTVSKLSEIGQKPLMMPGKIQSGKTRAFIGVITLSFDNGYDLSIVLTKNSNALVKQTVARMKSEFSSSISEDKIDVYDIMMIPDSLSRYELQNKVIIVVKNNIRIFRN